MALRELMARFLTIGEAFAGGGPDHPRPDLEPRVEAFLHKSPRLLRDPGYVEFLRTYGGASLSFPDEGNEQWVVMLPSLIEGDARLVPFTAEGYGVDPDGFLLVAQLFHQVSQVELEFGYHV